MALECTDDIGDDRTERQLPEQRRDLRQELRPRCRDEMPHDSLGCLLLIVFGFDVHWTPSRSIC